MTINDFPMRKSVSAQPRRRRYRVYNPNDDPEFDPELGSTDDLGAEGRGLGGGIARHWGVKDWRTAGFAPCTGLTPLLCLQS